MLALLGNHTELALFAALSAPSGLSAPLQVRQGQLLTIAQQLRDCY